MYDHRISIQQLMKKTQKKQMFSINHANNIQNHEFNWQTYFLLSPFDNPLNLLIGKALKVSVCFYSINCFVSYKDRNNHCNSVQSGNMANFVKQESSSNAEKNISSNIQKKSKLNDVELSCKKSLISSKSSEEYIVDKIEQQEEQNKIPKNSLKNYCQINEYNIQKQQFFYDLENQTAASLKLLHIQLDTLQIQYKKRSLLQRQVTNWTYPKKYQKRQIRRLLH